MTEQISKEIADYLNLLERIDNQTQARKNAGQEMARSGDFRDEESYPFQSG